MNLLKRIFKLGGSARPIVAEEGTSSADEILEQELALTHEALAGFNTISMFKINPDDLVQRKGIKTYTEMYNRDDTVRNAINFKILARLSTGFEILPADEEVEPRAVEMRDSIKYSLDHMDGSMTENLRQIMLAVKDGFSVTEIVLQMYDQTHGKYSGKYGLRALKTKNPMDFGFDVDKFGNLKTQDTHGEDGLIQGYSMGQNRRLPPQKFIIFPYMMTNGNWYGSSDLRPAYRPFKIKDGVLRYWAISLERFGMPTLYAQIMNQVNMGTDDDLAEAPGGMSQSSKKRLIKILKNLQAGTSGYVPSDVEIKKVEEMRGRAAYESAVEYCDRSMARAILLPSTTMEEGRRSGSLALGRQHGQAFQYVLEHLGHLVEEVMNEQLIVRHINLNFPMPQAYPKFKFIPFSGDKILAHLEVVKEAIDSGIIDPKETWIRERLLIPPKEDEPKGAEPASPRSAAPGKLPPEPEVQEDKSPDDFLLESVVPYLEGKHQAGDFPRHESVRSYVERLAFQAGDGKRRSPATAQVASQKDLKVPKSDIRPRSDLEKRVDFQDVQENWRELVDWTVDRLEKVMAQVKASVLASAPRVIKSGNQGDVDKFKLSSKLMGEFRRIMRNFYLIDYANGAKDAISEVEKGVGQNIKKLGKFMELGNAVHMFQPEITPKEAVDAIINKVPTVRRNLPVYNRRAFTVTNVENERILNQVQRALATGISRGSSNKAIMDQLEDIFTPYVLTGEIRDGQLLTAGRLETLVRTNLGEAYNTGRRAAFEDPEISRFVQAYQYSAIIDPRTTEFCENHDLFTRPVNDPVWDTIWPPNHFNCRSIVVAAVTGDTWERTENKPALEPQDGFKLAEE